MALIFGYARVSTNGQTLDGQVEQLRRSNCSIVFKEKISGADRSRPALSRLLRRAATGDIICVTRLDRLARSTRDLLNILGELNERQVGFRSLGDPWADTTTAHGRLMVTVLGGLAEFERELILARTAEGRARAVAMGVRLGRPPKLDLRTRQAALTRHAEGEPWRRIAEDLKVSASTLSRLTR